MWMSSLVLWAALGQGAPEQVEARPVRSEEPPRWEIWLGATGGVRSSGVGATDSGDVGITRAVGKVLRPELQLGLGVYGGPFELGSRIRFGTEVAYPREGLRPFLWVAFAHQHESEWGNVRKDPVPVVIGLSENGVNHRTGAELGAGLTYDLPRRTPDGFAGRLRVRASVMDLLGSGPALYADLLASVGVCF